MQTLLCLVAAVLICLPSIGGAAYPERVINMIIAHAPGGGTDVVARALAPYLEKHIGANARIVVLNRAGEPSHLLHEAPRQRLRRRPWCHQ
jgi:tripartite-type tricarboxylate transporter receptor subunit TctC